MSSTTESIVTRNSVATMSSYTLQGAAAIKPTVSIYLKGEEEDGLGYYSRRTRTFSTMDVIEGVVCVVAPADTRFDEIFITFEGTTRTWIDKFGPSPTASGRSEAAHTFLRLSQPVEESSLPVPRIAEKGKKYTFPFTFVVPQRMLPTMCPHHTTNDMVHETHLQLPPSMGDASLPSENGCLVDDVAPDMTKISYSIRVKIVVKRDSDGRSITLKYASRKLRILPTSEDQPPVHISDHGNTEQEEEEEDYNLRKEKDIRKGLFKGKKLGRISISAEQPRPLHLTRNSLYPPTTMVPILLEFTPADDSHYEPPKCHTLTSKLRITTYYSTSPISCIPTQSRSRYDTSLRNYSEQILLSSRSVGSAIKWTKTSASTSTSSPPTPDVDSAYANSSSSSSSISSSTRTPPPSSSSVNKMKYTATILVPVTAPKCKLLPPSFHSCLVSRVYSLEISLSLATTSSIRSRLKLKLRIPIQISLPPPPPPSLLLPGSPRPSLSLGLSNANEESGGGDVDALSFFTPRSVAPLTPPSSFTASTTTTAEDHDRALLLPPGYTLLPPVAVHVGREGLRRVLVRIPEPVGISPGCG